MKSPQSPHSSSLWVFALSAVESYRPLHPVPISQLGTKLLLYGSFVGWPKGHLSGWRAVMLGLGDWQHELIIRIFDVCVSMNEHLVQHIKNL